MIVCQDTVERLRYRTWFALACGLCCVVGSAMASADASDDLIPDSVWYDSDAGTLKPIPVTSTFDDSPNRNSRWLPKPDKVKRTSTTTTAAGGSTSSGKFGQAIGWLLLAVMGVLVVVAIVYAIKNSEADLFRPLGPAAVGSQADEAMRQRMKELPAELQQHAGDMRGEAERLMTAGDFDHAIVLLYGHQLLLLDRHAWLRLTRGKTNHRYVREVRHKSRDLSGQLKMTVDAFERSYFGRHVITPAVFAGLWDNNLAIEAAVHEAREAA